MGRDGNYRANRITWKISAHPAAAVDHVDVHPLQSYFPGLRHDFLETRVVRLPGGPQKGRRAPGGCLPRGRHFCFSRLLARAVCKIYDGFINTALMLRG